MSAEAMPENAMRPTRVRWIVFALAFATSAILYLHRYAFSFIKPKLVEEWKISKTELGTIDSAFSFCYSAFQFPIALAADAFGVRIVLPALIATWSVGMGLIAWAPAAGAMAVAMAVLGIGQSAVYACLSRMARIWFPPAVRTTMQGLVGILAGRLGALSTSLIFTSLLLGALQMPWRTATWVLTAIGAALAVVVALGLRNSPQTDPRVNAAEKELIEPGSSIPAAPAARWTMRSLFRQLTPRSMRNVLALTSQSIFSTFADTIYSNWIGLYLFEKHRLNFQQMGIYSALPLLGGAFAGFLGGTANDLLIARTGNRRWSRVGVAVAGKTLAAALVLVALRFDGDARSFCLFLFFIKLFGDCSLTTAWGVVTDIGGRATASVFAFNNMVAGIGLVSAPVVFGYLADHYGWTAVFQSVALAYLLCAASWFFIDCTIPVLEESPPGENVPT